MPVYSFKANHLLLCSREPFSCSASSLEETSELSYSGSLRTLGHLLIRGLNPTHTSYSTASCEFTEQEAMNGLALVSLLLAHTVFFSPSSNPLAAQLFDATAVQERDVERQIVVGENTVHVNFDIFLRLTVS